MDNWNEIRTAYQVARLGTISAAAEHLGVHRSTVIRHIDALEARLGEKVFLRHARGYTPTEVGLDLMRVAKAADEQFSQLVGRTKGNTTALSGEFIVTSMYVIAPMLIPVLNAFQAHHPNVVVKYIANDRLLRLEYGEAHVAIRTGAKPEQPDNVALPFTNLRIGLHASREYVERHGIPHTSDDFAHHSFVGLNTLNAGPPFHLWMLEHVPENNIIFRSNSPLVLEQAILLGTGIGFCAAHRAAQYANLVEVWSHQDEWDIPFWLVTHVDLHQTTKVQTFLSFLKKQENTLKG